VPRLLPARLRGAGKAVSVKAGQDARSSTAANSSSTGTRA
jgi:hypothetical protein